MFLNGEAIGEPDARGERIVDDSFLILFNAYSEELEFTIPPEHFGAEWSIVFDTSRTSTETVTPVTQETAIEPIDGPHTAAAGSTLSVKGRSIVLLTRSPLGA